MQAIEKGVSEADLRQMHELDNMYGAASATREQSEMSPEEEEYIRRRMEERMRANPQEENEDDEEYIKDPYAKS